MPKETVQIPLRVTGHEAPHFVGIETRLLDAVPINYRSLKWLMMAQARRKPRIEIGGIIFTDQRDATKLICVVSGSEVSLKIPLPDFELLERGGFNTCVSFHSHPSGAAEFSGGDNDGFRCLSFFADAHLGLRRLMDQGAESIAPLFLYDFVVSPKGRIARRGLVR